MNNPLLYYNFITEFKKQYYKGALGLEHLQGEEIEIKKLSLPDGGVDEEANFWGYVLKRDNTKFLLSSYKLDLKKDLPIIPSITEKVAYRGQVYYLIRKPTSIKIRPDKKMSFRELIDKLTYFEHSNKKHQKLLMIITIAQMIERINIRVSTPPSFGKDSNVVLANLLFGGSKSIITPTIPKLEFLSSICKLLNISEVIDLTNEQWKTLEPMLLDIADFKPTVEKHSRSFGQVGETIDVNNLSISLSYNDINVYPDPYKYIDYVVKGSITDRIPAFRLFGTIKEDFNSTNNIDASSWVTMHTEEYKDILHTYTHFKKNYKNERKFYPVSVDFKNMKIGFKKMPERWLINLYKILPFFEIYSESQGEFDAWCKLLANSLEDYQQMLKFPKLYEECIKRYPNELSKIKSLVESNKLFVDKNKALQNYSKTGNASLGDDKLW